MAGFRVVGGSFTGGNVGRCGLHEVVELGEDEEAVLTLKLK